MAKKKAPADNRPSVVNRQARFNYELLDRFEAGIVLTGSEVKAVREGNAQLTDAYCYFKRDGLYVKNLRISPYKQGGYANHEPTRERKLLLNKTELRKLGRGSREKGLTIVPTKLYFNARNLIKLEVALAQGKKSHDKREAIKARETKRDLQRRLREG